jgi:siroheme synthase-like protein
MRRKQNPVPVLPVSLLVQGRRCLVVGGGKIALRKVGHLLDAEADVMVAAPEIVDELREWVVAGRVAHIARAFSVDDVTGCYLVYAATDSEEVNASVIDACKEQGVLCSAIDSNWPRGDLVMPAITRKAGLTVSVATGGRSCTEARVIKERIADMLDGLGED